MQQAERSGNIYDLGYRGYDGLRLGRKHAISSLYFYTLRSAFGLGRRPGSKIIPIAIAIIALIPAAGQLAIAALVSDVEVYTPSNYFAYIEVPVALFCAAIAPEICGRDMRQRTLSLYFSRALHRRDYILAKLGAFATALTVLTLFPQAVLVIGNGLASKDLWGYVQDNWAELPRTIASGLFIAAVVASVSLAIATQTSRRAYATIAVVAWFLVTFPIGGILVEVSHDTGRYALFLSPFEFIHGATLWIFNASPGVDTSMDLANFPQWVYPLVALAYGIAGFAFVVRRFDRISA
ncbi:MAG TPA: ABC transporter permease subunit [Tepidiformaceae bacterium]|nr:ABC transporter permease subunit [Tepidiformaceae bacterium]HNO64953.1 ABC transporter permease subunit [Tepidiformaceae bacterium]